MLFINFTMILSFHKGNDFDLHRMTSTVTGMLFTNFTSSRQLMATTFNMLLQGRHLDTSPRLRLTFSAHRHDVTGSGHVRLADAEHALFETPAGLHSQLVG